MESPAPPVTRRPISYALVFLVLAIITAVELGVKGLGLPRAATNVLFLLLSLGKATMVAAFYMHLRRDSRMYTAIFLLPVILFVVFALLTIVI
ncbi:MAG TPA: cytochrome C oxidase subunit IV family protein [Anaerolineales bacterium]|nr:cytochrome C oxidase subunit IV family protein [Anaerolineales bacterium]